MNCGQAAGRIKLLFHAGIDLGHGHVALDGVRVPPKFWVLRPIFDFCSIDIAENTEDMRAIVTPSSYVGIGYIKIPMTFIQ